MSPSGSIAVTLTRVCAATSDATTGDRRYIFHSNGPSECVSSSCKKIVLTVPPKVTDGRGGRDV